MIDFPNGKINIGLSVSEKRADGFHNLETIFYPIKIHDILEIIMATDRIFSFTTTGIKLDGKDKDNLVCKAYERLKIDFNLPAVKIHLHKAIPTGAGLGGGSADAAFAIRMLNTIFKLGLNTEKMQDYARTLGSDCAFFIENKSALATGRGDQFEPIELNLADHFMVIVKPDTHIRTPEAYSWIKPFKKEQSLKELIRIPLKDWKNLVINDFEAEVIKRYNEIQKIRDDLYQIGAIYASLTGSGSAVYGIFDHPVPVGRKFQNYFVWTSLRAY
jgi:4-diphosphocytidyl-2-C-methyl-D-erythritol kinase